MNDNWEKLNDLAHLIEGWSESDSRRQMQLAILQTYKGKIQYIIIQKDLHPNPNYFRCRAFWVEVNRRKMSQTSIKLRMHQVIMHIFILSMAIFNSEDVPNKFHEKLKDHHHHDRVLSLSLCRAWLLAVSERTASTHDFFPPIPKKMPERRNACLPCAGGGGQGCFGSLHGGGIFWNGHLGRFMVELFKCLGEDMIVKLMLKLYAELIRNYLCKRQKSPENHSPGTKFAMAFPQTSNTVQHSAWCLSSVWSANSWLQQIAE